MRSEQYGYILIGLLIVGGARYWLTRIRAFAQRITTPRTEYVATPEPIRSRVWCIGCQRLVRRDLVAWDGSEYICEECSFKEAV